MKFEMITHRCPAPEFDENTRVTYLPGAKGVPTLGQPLAQKFTPDGTGGGTLAFPVLRVRKGFRPAVVDKVIQKEPLRGA